MTQPNPLQPRFEDHPSHVHAVIDAARAAADPRASVARTVSAEPPPRGRFGVLAVGSMLAQQGVQVSPMWLIVVYLLHTWGELALSPVGLSAMSKLAPVRIGGLVMGVWFLASSVGNYIGGRLAGFYEAMPLPTLFGTIGAFGIAAGIVFFLIAKPIGKMERAS